MIDNTWMKSDRRKIGANGQVRIVRAKVLTTVIIIMAAGLGVILFHDLGSNATLYQSEGILIDFGEYRTQWTDVDYTETTDPMELLDIACSERGIDRVIDPDGNLFSVQYTDGITTVDVTNDPDHTWGLWTVGSDGSAKRSGSYDIDASDYTVTIWAYTDNNGGKPAVAVDSSNTSIYGYSNGMSPKIVTLSPLATEVTCAVGGTTTIVGTDQFSDYPASIRAGKEKGNIAVVGTYLSPSYESIMNAKPDLVICDSSSGNHIPMAQKLRNSSVNAVLLYDAVDIQSIFDNIFIVSAAMNYGTAAKIISDMKSAIAQIDAKTAESSKVSSMISLGAVASPYVAGKYTYADNILAASNGINVFGDMPGWPLITAEFIPEKNPSLIFVIDSGGYKVSEYNIMIDQLSRTMWKDTDAFHNGEIYLFTEDFGSMAQRAGPRFVQFYEIVARVINPGCFDDEQQMRLNSTNAIGSDYTDYITYSRFTGV